MKLGNEARATIAMFGIALILSLGGLAKFAGAGLIGAGIYTEIINQLNQYDKHKKNKKVKNEMQSM